MIFIAAEVAEVGGVFQGELQRLNRMVKTYEMNFTRNIFCGAQNGERIRRRAEANVPDHKFAGVILETFTEPELVDVKRFRLRDRADDRMKRLVIRKRAD